MLGRLTCWWKNSHVWDRAKYRKDLDKYWHRPLESFKSEQDIKDFYNGDNLPKAKCLRCGELR